MSFLHKVTAVTDIPLFDYVNTVANRQKLQLKALYFNPDKLTIKDEAKLRSSLKKMYRRFKKDVYRESNKTNSLKLKDLMGLCYITKTLIDYRHKDMTDHEILMNYDRKCIFLDDGHKGFTKVYLGYSINTKEEPTDMYKIVFNFSKNTMISYVDDYELSRIELTVDEDKTEVLVVYNHILVMTNVHNIPHNADSPNNVKYYNNFKKVETTHTVYCYHSANDGFAITEQDAKELQDKHGFDIRLILMMEFNKIMRFYCNAAPITFEPNTNIQKVET